MSNDENGHTGKREELTRTERYIGLAVLVILLVGCYVIVRPFISSLLWAMVLSFALWPLNWRLIGWLRGRRTLAALIITLTLAAALVAPLMITVANLADDAHDLTIAGRRWMESGQKAAPNWLGKIPMVGKRATQYWNDMAGELASATSTTQPTSQPSAEQSRLRQTLRAVLMLLKTWIVAFGLVIGEGVVQIGLSLLLTFFFLKDGEALAQRIKTMAARVSGDRGMQLLDVAGGTVRGVVYGILGTAVAQGLIAGVGFLIAGVPGATLLGLLTFFLSVVPMGPPLIWIPVSIWLFHKGSSGWGIFMLVWGAGVSSIDNIIKPWLISRGSNAPFIIIFFGVVGGALAFGLIGVFIGPTLLAVTYRLIQDWSSARLPVPAPAAPHAGETNVPSQP